MATWVAHFRLAQALLDLEQGFELDRRSFLVGNIAPDSGVLNADKTGYEPSKQVSHWEDQRGDIQPERFYTEQLANRTFSAAEYAFRVGFYCHLIADRVWTEAVWRPKKATPLYADALAKDQQFIWEIKKDWYGLDFLYLQENPNSIFYTDFVHIKDVPDYLGDKFPAGAFTQRVQETQTLYLNAPSWDLDRPYIYLSRAEWEAYIAQTLVLINQSLIEKGIGVSNRDH